MVYVAQKRVLRAYHPHALTTGSNLARTLFVLGSMPRAQAMSQEVHVAHKRVLGADHLETLRTGNDLATSLTRQRKDAERSSARCTRHESVCWELRIQIDSR